MEPLCAAGVVIRHAEMVVDVTPVWTEPRLSPTQRNSFSRQFSVHGPTHFVDAVNGLFDDVVSR